MKVEIDREMLQVVFDAAVGSLDFTSGFLDDEEIGALRAVAVVLGVDPKVATPSNFICKFEYDNVHDWETVNSLGVVRCRRCLAFET